MIEREWNNVGMAKFFVVDKRSGECPSERENGVVRKQRSANCFQHADRSRQSWAKALTLWRALQAAYIYYVFMHAPTHLYVKYILYVYNALTTTIRFLAMCSKVKAVIIRSQK